MVSARPARFGVRTPINVNPRGNERVIKPHQESMSIRRVNSRDVHSNSPTETPKVDDCFFYLRLQSVDPFVMSIRL